MLFFPGGEEEEKSRGEKNRLSGMTVLTFLSKSQIFL